MTILSIRDQVYKLLGDREAAGKRLPSGAECAYWRTDILARPATDGYADIGRRPKGGLRSGKERRSVRLKSTYTRVTRQCLACKMMFERTIYRSGKRKSLAAFMKRRFCSPHARAAGSTFIDITEAKPLRVLKTCCDGCLE